MKRFAVLGLVVLTSILSLSEARRGGYVRGYTRSNGTYVSGYYRGGSSSGSSAYTPSPSLTTTFHSCADAQAAGYSNMTVGSSGYSSSLDRDSDGIACESGGGDTAVNGVSTPIKTVKSTTSPKLSPPKPLYTQTGVNLRQMASGDSKMLATLKKDELVSVDSCDGKWCKVHYGSLSGYLVKSALESSVVQTVSSVPLAVAPNSKTNGATITPSKNSSLCPKFSLSSFFVTVNVPAKFPNPESEITSSHLECGSFIIKYSGDEFDIHKKIYVKSQSWKDAWKVIVDKGGLGTDLNVDTDAQIDIINGLVTVNRDYTDVAIDKSAVIAMSSNGGNLKPILFSSKITPQKIVNGSNKIYQKGSYPYGNYQLIEINTISQTITLTPVAAFPK